MAEPNRRVSDAKATSLAVLLLLAGCGTAPQAGNDSGNDANAAAPANVAAVEPPPPAAPLPPSRLARADLISAATVAADATASGASLPESNLALVGRGFEVRLPFGCEGPAAFDGRRWAAWSLNAETQVLKLGARTEISQAEPWVQAVTSGTEHEAVEGFWLRRPWSSAEACPPNASAVEPQGEAPEPQTLALAQLFAPGAPRTLRRGSRPYSATVKLAGDAPAAPYPFRLVLSGRVTGFADRQPVHCWQPAADVRPRCLIAVEFTRVAFEDASDGTVLSEWKS